MYAPPHMTDLMVRHAIAIARDGQQADSDSLSDLDAPVYITDGEGTITAFSRACVPLAGRLPEVGKDRWCVTWRLYTVDGTYLPHDKCPMAVAIQTRTPVRGVTAIAERPDGTRIDFMPYPTPVLDDQGNLICAVNLLVDVTKESQAGYFSSESMRCRRLSNVVDDSRAAERLRTLAAEYEMKALALRSGI